MSETVKTSLSPEVAALVIIGTLKCLYSGDQERDEHGRWTKEAITESVEHYTSEGYRRMNGCARGQSGCDKNTKAHIEKMDAAFDNPAFYDKTSKTQIMYRGLGSAKVTDKLMGAKGKVIGDKAFVSMSKSKSTALDFADHSKGSTLLVVTVPKGVKYLRGSDWSNLGERERIFARGTKLKITDVKVKENFWGERQFTIFGRLKH